MSICKRFATDLTRLILAALLSIMSSFSAHAADGELPDGIDRAALTELRSKIEFEQKHNAEWPVENVLNHLATAVRKTAFDRKGDRACDARKRTLAGTGRRPEDVSEDEWQALQATTMTNDVGFNMTPAVVLVDLDGDGLRDLTVEDAIGGTASVVSTFRRVGDHFEWQGYWYLTDVRGVNQTQWLVSLNGRAYMAFRDGVFGVDHVYLLRPFHTLLRVPRLSVRYRYLLEVPAIQRVGGVEGNDDFRFERLDGALHAALNAAVVTNTPQAPATGDALPSAPLCPLPATTLDDGAEVTYFSFGTQYYADEWLGDFPVLVGDKCYIGRLIDHHGSYEPNYGLLAYLQIRLPESESLNGRSYEVAGRREVIGLDSDMAPPTTWLQADEAFQ